MKTNTQTRLLHSEQVIQKFHELGMDDVSKRTIDQWCADGTLSFVVVARKRRFREDLLDGMIARWVKEAA